MRRIRVVVLVLASLVSVATTTNASDAREPLEPSAPIPAACIPAERCCRICDQGQACGNSCIAQSKTCHKGRGCACDAAELCGAE
jgi:hypothetical protein